MHFSGSVSLFIYAGFSLKLLHTYIQGEREGGEEREHQRYETEIDPYKIQVQ